VENYQMVFKQMAVFPYAMYREMVSYLPQTHRMAQASRGAS
jgi:hypothetical protein